MLVASPIVILSVSPQHRVKPDARIPADLDVAQNDRSLSDISGRIDDHSVHPSFVAGF